MISKQLRNTALLLGGIYLILLVAKRIWELPFVLEAYVTDFLCLPIVLTFALAVLRRVKRDLSIVLSPMMIAAAVAYISVVFELILPRWSSTYVADGWDVLAYSSGGVLFYALQQKLELPWIDKLQKSIK